MQSSIDDEFQPWAFLRISMVNVLYMGELVYHLYLLALITIATTGPVCVYGVFLVGCRYIRKNRTSIAVLTGHESKEELQGLGADIFSYFGMGCRSVSHLLVPENYDIQQVFANIVEYNDVINNNKYGNNYDYYRALFLLNQDDFLENGFLIVRENEELHTPVSILHYSTYGKEGPVEQLTKWENQIQCIVGQAHLPLGTAQKPRLWDYADGVNTMNFLKNL